VRAGVLLGEQPILAFAAIDENQTLALVQGGLNRVGQPADVGVALGIVFSRGDQAIDDQVDVMLALLVERNGPREVARHPVDPHPGESICPRLRQDILVASLAVASQWRQHLESRTRGQRCRTLHDLLCGLRMNSLAAARTVRRPDAGIEDPEVVIDLRYRGHRRARVLADGFLLNRDGRAQPPDIVCVRFLHLSDELPRVGR